MAPTFVGPICQSNIFPFFHPISSSPPLPIATGLGQEGVGEVELRRDNAREAELRLAKEWGG